MAVVLVSAADANFFDLLSELIQSVRNHPKGNQVAIAILDLGLTPLQLEQLKPRIDRIHVPPWEHSFPPSAKIPSHYRALFARPYLRNYFPGFDTYLWIDADAWVQDWNAIDLYLQGSEKRGLAIVQEMDRSNRVIRGSLGKVMEEWAQWYGSHFGPALGRRMANYPMCNAGVFALNATAPQWKLWEESLAAALKVSCSNLADQLALNVVIYQSGLLAKTEFLPSWCNWMCHCCLPTWDVASQTLVEPYLPHTPIGILHLSGEKKGEAPLETTTGEMRLVRLRYPVAARN